MDLLGGLISAGSNLLGGWLNNQNQQSINQQNLQQQLNFAQNGIQWKVADAKAAGINPLAALGAPTASFSNLTGSDSMGQGVSNAGQDIGRAIQAMQSPADKAAAVQKTQLDLESTQLDNDLKRARLASSIATTHQAGQPPGLPRDRSTESIQLPDRAFSRTPDGGYAVMPSKDVQDRNYGMIGEVSTAIRNRTAGFFDPDANAPPVPLKPGHYWSFDPVSGVYYQQRRGWLRDWIDENLH